MNSERIAPFGIVFAAVSQLSQVVTDVVFEFKLRIDTVPAAIPDTYTSSLPAVTPDTYTSSFQIPQISTANRGSSELASVSKGDESTRSQWKGRSRQSARLSRFMETHDVSALETRRRELADKDELDMGSLLQTLQGQAILLRNDTKKFQQGMRRSSSSDEVLRNGIQIYNSAQHLDLTLQEIVSRDESREQNAIVISQDLHDISETLFQKISSLNSQSLANVDISQLIVIADECLRLVDVSN